MALTRRTRDRASSVMTTSLAGNVQADLLAMEAEILNVNTFLDWVTPEQFGAIGNGIADDTAAINLALATGKDVHMNGSANYRITAQLVWPWKDSGYQSLLARGALITLPNLKTTAFGQRLANGTVQKITIRKNYYDLSLQGPVSTRDVYAEVNGTDGFYISYGCLVRCKAQGLTTGASVMGYTVTQSFYADNMRNAGLRSEGVLNSVIGLTAGWTAGDTLIIKSDYSYYADIYAEYAGVIPSDTLEPGPQQGSLISFAQDGNNAGGNVVNGAGCRYYGAGAITVNGFENHVGGVLSIGRPADTSFAAVDRYDPAIYIGGTNCSLGNVQAVSVYGGVHLHNGSVNCHIGVINLGTISDLNANCQALVASGTCTNCKIDGVIVSGVAKVDSVFISMSDLYIGLIRIRNMNIPTASGVFPVRIGGTCIVNEVDITWNPTSLGTTTTVNISGSARVNRLDIHGAMGCSLVVNSNVAPVLGDILLNPNPVNTTRPAEFGSADASFTRYIRSLVVTGTTQPRGNGIVILGSYVGSAWLRLAPAQTLVASYPTIVDHTVTS